MPRAYPADPGERDRLVTIQQATQTADASSFPTVSWSTLTTCYMAMAPLSGRERVEQGQISAAADTRFEMGYRSDMDPELVDVPKTRRLAWQGRTYDIVVANLIPRRMGVELIALSRVG